jgi:hypothetical protein
MLTVHEISSPHPVKMNRRPGRTPAEGGTGAESAADDGDIRPKDLPIVLNITGSNSSASGPTKRRDFNADMPMYA